MHIKTDKNRLKKWLKAKFALSESNVKYIANLGYSDCGRLSRRFLSENLLVLLNLMTYVDEEQRGLLYRTVVDRGLSTLFIEPRSVKSYELVNQILDEDFA